MRVMIIDSYYGYFLDSFYAGHPGLDRQPYACQWRELMDACFGAADYYSENLKRLGHEATDVVTNCRPLQWRWARENGTSIPWSLGRRRLGPVAVPWIGRRGWELTILRAQIERFRPDVIHMQNPAGIPTAFLREIRPLARLITGQIASPYPASTDFAPYDLMLSSFPHYVELFRRMGVRSEYFRLGFEPAILNRLRRTEPHGAVFVGGMSRAHTDRIRFFEELARQSPIEWWGYGEDNLNADSPLRTAWRGPAWALEMFQRLYNARIAINHHIDVAGNYANNMRLYEATGVGAMLLTDAKANLAEQFEPGRELVVYHSAAECAELIRHYLDHEAERAAIAKAGQQRTLREHSYFHRMQEYVGMVQALLA